MHIATVVLSVLLAVEFAFTGLIKILGTATARANAEHLGISLRLSRLIGVAELAAVVGLLAGIAVKPLVIVTSAAVVLLIAGAVGYHLKARTSHRSASRGAHGTGGHRAARTHRRVVVPHRPEPDKERRPKCCFPSPPSPSRLPRRDMLPSERREFVRTHRTCVYGYRRRHDGPAMSVVYDVPTDDDELLVSTMAPRGKARPVARDGKVSLCVLDERWPFVYLQVYADAVVDRDRDLVVDATMAVAGRMSGQPLGDEARRTSRRWRTKRIESSFAAVPTRLSRSHPGSFIKTTRWRRSLTGCRRWFHGTHQIRSDDAPRIGNVAVQRN